MNAALSLGARVHEKYGLKKDRTYIFGTNINFFLSDKVNAGVDAQGMIAGSSA